MEELCAVVVSVKTHCVVCSQVWHKLNQVVHISLFSFHYYSQTKGQSLHSLIHRRGHQFSFQSATKIMSQIAQVREKILKLCVSVSGDWIKML